MPMRACWKPSLSGSATPQICRMPRSTSRLVRARTAASETPSAAAIWVNGRRPSSWRCSMIFLSSAESSSARAFRRPASSGFESRSGWPMALESSTGSGPASVAALAAIEVDQDGRERLDRFDRDRVDDQLDLGQAEVPEGSDSIRNLAARTLERRDVVLVVFRQSAGAPGQPDEQRTRLLQGGGVATDPAASLVYLLEDRLEPIWRVVGLPIPDVPRVDMRQGDLEHPRTHAANHERRPARSRRLRQQLAVARLEELPVEVDGAVAEQRPDDRERLLEPRDAMVEGEAERGELGLVPARAQAEDQPSPADLVHGRSELGEHGRRMERRRRHERAEPDAGRARGDRREHRPDLPGTACRAVFVAVQEVVTEPH